MSKHAFFAAVIVAAALILTVIANADGPLRNDERNDDRNDGPIPFFGDVRGPLCSTDTSMSGDLVGVITARTPSDTLLFNHTRRMGMPAACTPLLAPDGHQITLGEFKEIEAKASVKCISSGTRSALHFSDLQPNGTYSVWLLTPTNGVLPGPPYNNVGTLGRTALSENTFTSRSGQGQITVTTPEELSVMGHIGPCFLDVVSEIHLVYHSDGQTHGFTPAFKYLGGERPLFVPVSG